MSITSAKAQPKRRGGSYPPDHRAPRRAAAGGGGVLLAQQRGAGSGQRCRRALTVYQPAVTVAHNGGSFSSSSTGAIIEPGDSIKTDAKGRAAIQLPDGTLTRLAGDTQITLTSAHFAKSGNLHDVSILQKIGRTFHQRPASRRRRLLQGRRPIRGRLGSGYQVRGRGERRRHHVGQAL